MDAAEALADPARDCLDRAYQYARDVKSGKVVACKYVKLAVKRWFDDLKHGEKRGLYFVEAYAYEVFEFTHKYCKHYQGEWAGNAIELSDWQCFIHANVFGWIREDGTRRFRIVYEEVARKNGKTTKAASVGAYLAGGDYEPGAKVYCAATKKDQAREVYDSIVKMIEKDRELSQKMVPLRNAIRCSTNNSPDSRIELLAADSNSMDGFNVHGAIVDEIHAHRDSGVWDVLESGRGARRQPLMWGITTAGKNQNGFCYELRGYAIKVLERSIQDDAFFGIIFTLDDDDDWTDPSVWVKANPNLSVSVFEDDMLAQCRKAQEMPSAALEFQTKRCNRWVFGEAAWMNMLRWNDNHDPDFDEIPCWVPGEPSPLDGRECHGGLDLASVEDLCALSFDFKEPDGTHRFISRAYLPQAAFDKRIQKGGLLRSLYSKFKEAGFLVVTPGEVCDYGFIERDILNACARFNVKEIAFDRFNSSQLVSDLLAQDVPMVAMGQGTGSVSAPMKEMLRLVLADKVKHANPVLTFAMSNVVSVANAQDDIKFDKSKVSEKIDPAVAAIMALGRSMVLDENESIDSVDDLMG